MKVAVLGNCQSLPLVQCLRTMLPDHTIVRINSNLAAPEFVKREVEKADIIVAQSVDNLGNCAENKTICLYPRFHFRPLAPDQTRVDDDEGQVLSPIGKPHSAITFFGWQQRLSIDATVELYRSETFHALGYMQLLEPALMLAREEGLRVGIADLAELYKSWLTRGRFIHIIHHPRLFVMADIARSICERLELKPTIPNPEDFLHDPMLSGPVWALYPAIAEQYGMVGGALFKAPDDRENRTKGRVIGLREFVASSFAIYDGATNPRCPATDELNFASLIPH